MYDQVLKTTEELMDLLKEYNFTRSIKFLDVHHTWKPNHSNFNGSNHSKVNKGMRDYHVNDNGWSDIAQHLTLFPDGKWLMGRDFNKTPASIANHNTGAFMIEMVGDFDVGNDTLEGEQLNSILEFSKFFKNQFNIEIRFHREYASWKSCPGSSIDKAEFLEQIDSFGEDLSDKEFYANQILSKVTDYPERWIPGKEKLKEIATSGDCNKDLQIYEYFDDLIIKLYEYAGGE